ncbi:MAG TPA: cob(I)yrinic acid a,c-diamide adenosyltransferase [Oligoflexia bacterium]|nr:cob(I)yrinic acid a,c-diamide adenosyltransferase [Oligoflexia bacterium]HMP47965.1 cob(I)yrinic acid a,c-diamide adenosyltransferase [Oligoflexia bacterium]
MAKFRINRVYTRSGDDGETSLVDGSRVLKSSLRPSAFGTLDELNSCLGICKEELSDLEIKSDDSSFGMMSVREFSIIKGVIEYLQQELFDLGSELATPSEYNYEGMWRVSESHVRKLEFLCDYFNEGLPELNSFILPGGSKISSYLHLARTIARRAERIIVELNSSKTFDSSFECKLGSSVKSEVSPYCMQYINRLSDLLFVLGRYVLTKQNLDAPLWVSEMDRVLPCDLESLIVSKSIENKNIKQN